MAFKIEHGEKVFDEQSEFFWQFILEVAKLTNISNQELWKNEAPSITRADAIKAIATINANLRQKADRDFPLQIDEKFQFSFPKAINIGNFEDVLVRLGVEIVQYAYDHTQAQQKSRISVPDAILLFQYLHERLGSPIVRASGNESLRRYSIELMDNRRIIHKSKGGIESTTVAYSQFIGNRNSRPHSTKWVDKSTRLVYYYFSILPDVQDSTKSEEKILGLSLESSEKSRAIERIDRKIIPSNSINEVIEEAKSITKNKEAIFKHYFPKNIREDALFASRRPDLLHSHMHFTSP